MDLVTRLIARYYDAAMHRVENLCLGSWRRQLLHSAKGNILELGAGTGANLKHYPPTIARLCLTEPDRHMRTRLREKASRACLIHHLVAAEAENLPFADQTFDAVVATLVFCSVKNVGSTLEEVFRILKPNGELLLIEHVVASGPGRTRRWQKRIEPIWKRCAGNCHLTRDTRSSLERAGFDCSGIIRDRMLGAPFFAAPVIRGIARKT